MKIEIADFTAGAAAARGIAIIIDVFRACSLMALALQAGAKRVIPVADIDDALAMRSHYAGCLLIGERNARPLPGFDCGNSPTEVLLHRLTGRTIVQPTHAGTPSTGTTRRRVCANACARRRQDAHSPPWLERCETS